MFSALTTHLDHAETADPETLREALLNARRAHLEEPAAALAEAIRCYEIARSLGDETLCARARAIEGAVSVHRGDLASALELVVDADRHIEGSEDLTARTELAALKAELGFFTGSYTEALRQAELAVQLSDETGDLGLRIYARRATCIVFGNVGVRNWEGRVEELLALTIEAGDRWEQAISHNDLACARQADGNFDEAEREVERGLELVRAVSTGNTFALAVLYSTRAEVRLEAGRAEEALSDAELAIALLSDNGEPNPYVLGVTVNVEVQAQKALGLLDDARQSGEGALARLGDRVPQTRSLILSTLATAFREAGRLDDAYDALARSAELERQAFRELSELQLSLERATLEASAARSESDALAAKNRQLADAHAELERRAHQLEGLQEQLRDQAERDWLTGLHNRRYLARELDRLATGGGGVPLSLAVLDLDGFKSVNDRFGHDIGDRVLVRIAELLGDALRGSDVVVRSGGEEFLVLMPRTDAMAAAACCERIRTAVHSERWSRIARGLAVTTCVGVASTDDPGDLEALVKIADQRLYEAKRAGGDLVVSGPASTDGATDEPTRDAGTRRDDGIAARLRAIGDVRRRTRGAEQPAGGASDPSGDRERP
jgi:diguanylate cyclase (GGDEF)-like protein